MTCEGRRTGIPVAGSETRKSSIAMREVATISKLLSREAFAAAVRLRPGIRKTGAAISSTTMPGVYGRSFRVSHISCFP